VAAAYPGLGVKYFREEVAAGRLPVRERYGERLIGMTGFSTIM
jgi:hypothetical protein